VLSELESIPARLGALSVMTSGTTATDELEQLVTRTTTALESLRELTRGVFPTQLARSGLAHALSSHLARNGLAATLQVEPSADRRFPARVEAAIYYCCVEALRSGSPIDRVNLRIVGEELRLEIHGVARGGLDVQAIVDRVEAVGGSLAEVPAAVNLLSVSIPVGRTMRP